MKSHNQEETDYHPLVYKTKECSESRINPNIAHDLAFCPYSHNDQRKKFDLSFYSSFFDLDGFKTVFCEISIHHNHKICEFYHSKNDKRRDPRVFFYKNVMCTSLGCENENCEYSHNQVELEYHQDSYKAQTCLNPHCNMSNICPGLHDNDYKSMQKNMIDKEVKELKTKAEMLESLIAIENKKILEFSEYFCAFCDKVPSKVVLACGHLACPKCIPESLCQLCGTDSKPLITLAIQ